MDSILTSIKKLLGITEEDTSFDPDVIMHINTVLVRLSRLGVGPTTGFRIEDKNSYWSDFVSNTLLVEAVRTYVYLKVKLVFDPPLSATVIEAMKESIKELEWTLNEIVESPEVN